MAWTIEHSLSTPTIDSVWVSSDDLTILDVATEYGAQIIRRPERFSGNEASSESGWLHAIDHIEALGTKVDSVVAPQCTSPVRASTDFERALCYFNENELDSLFSATLVTDFNIWRQTLDGGFSSYTYDYKNRGRRQEKSDQYLENGSFWIFRPHILRTLQNRLGGKIGIWEMEFWKSFQIDEPSDLTFCAILMESYILNKSK